ncbi:hypothetical protein CH268_27195 [Rhodococcus sp. 06-1460-1B]|nr:hypothetical protein CH268_27195 [Rhodococcus sp. 06-1460-1B]
MGELASHLQAEVPRHIRKLDVDAASEWRRVSSALDGGKGLEDALGTGGLPEALVDAVTAITAQFVQEAEGNAVESILNSADVSPFGRMFLHILKACEIVDVVTTNYDRLIEVHAAKAGVRVDSMFYGHTVGRLDEELSRGELIKKADFTGRNIRNTLRMHPHIRLSKPHGSLDWFSTNSEYFRSDLKIPGSRLIVAPGGNKYRIGYEVPFDQQRNRANSAIQKASSLFFIGYGFNDDHLQTHLKRVYPQVPSVILSRTLTSSSRDYLKLNPQAVGIEAASDGKHSLISRGAETIEFEHAIWKLEDLNERVLGI